MKAKFPTRQRRLGAQLPSSLEGEGLESELSNGNLDEASNGDAPAGSHEDLVRESPLLSFVLGIDEQPRPMSRAQLEGLGDAFTQLFLTRGNNPVTLRGLLDGMEALPPEDQLPERRLFLVAEGGRHAMGHPGFELNARLVYSWSRRFGKPEIFLSTVPVLDDAHALLQLIAWSDSDGSFHFFERQNGQWFWAGNSFTALDPRARGKGPFDSHINGGLVMKELKEPWAHWQSMSSSIPSELLRDSDFGGHAGLRVLQGAEILESLTKASVRRWTKSRLQRELADGVVHAPRRLFRHVTDATSANLVSSKTQYAADMTVPIALPFSFFFDTDGFVDLGRRLAPGTRLVPAKSIEVSADDYLAALRSLDVGVRDRPGGRRVRGDTHFCFLVPERAFEDRVVVSRMVRDRVISARLAFCLLMVDFANPVRSPRRASLLRHCPESALSHSENALDAPFLHNVRDASAVGSAEEELLDYWRDPQLVTRAAGEFDVYVSAVEALAASSEGALAIVRLAESRREQFRRRKLHEFLATTAHSVPGVGGWSMSKAGEIVALANEAA